MELKNKSNQAADSTLEENLSSDDVAGREAALSFSGEDMTKAAAKRQACTLFQLLARAAAVDKIDFRLCSGSVAVIEEDWYPMSDACNDTSLLKGK